MCLGITVGGKMPPKESETPEANTEIPVSDEYLISPEEACDILSSATVSLGRCQGKALFYKALCTAVVALRYRTPKKIDRSSGSLCCPTCKCVLSSYDYCQCCGQKLKD